MGEWRKTSLKEKRVGKKSEAKQKGCLVKAPLMKGKTPRFEHTEKGSREGLRGMLKAQKEERSSGQMLTVASSSFSGILVPPRQPQVFGQDKDQLISLV